MAQVDRAGPLQLLCRPRQSQELGRVSESGGRTLVAYTSPPEPEAPDQLDTHPCPGYEMASSIAYAPSLSGCSLCRHSSEIRTGCANKRPSGSGRGAISNDRPYRDRQLRRSKMPEARRSRLELGTQDASQAAAADSAYSFAISRRSRCGSMRGCPVVSSHLFPGTALQVGQRTASACFRLSSFLMQRR
jgi:hypothetical protein